MVTSLNAEVILVIKLSFSTCINDLKLYLYDPLARVLD